MMRPHCAIGPPAVHTVAGDPSWMPSWMPSWLHDPVWVGAFATTGLFVFAVVTAVFALLAYRKQSAEVALLQNQASRDIEQRRRTQASKVFVTAGIEPAMGPGPANDVRVSNKSDQPIYGVVAFHGENQQFIETPVLRPGADYPVSAGIHDEHGNMPVVVLEFTDAAGVQWRTTSHGGLSEKTG